MTQWIARIYVDQLVWPFQLSILLIFILEYVWFSLFIFKFSAFISVDSSVKLFNLYFGYGHWTKAHYIENTQLNYWNVKNWTNYSKLIEKYLNTKETLCAKLRRDCNMKNDEFTFDVNWVHAKLPWLANNNGSKRYFHLNAFDQRFFNQVSTSKSVHPIAKEPSLIEWTKCFILTIFIFLIIIKQLWVFRSFVHVMCHCAHTINFIYFQSL